MAINQKLKDTGLAIGTIIGYGIILTGIVMTVLLFYTIFTGEYI